MNDEMLVLFFQFFYSVQVMRHRQTARGSLSEIDQVMLGASEEAVDALLLRLEAARERPPQEAGDCV